MNVMVANFYGSKMYEDLNDTIHTAILTAMIGGTALLFIGIIIAEPVLGLMGTPEDVIGHSVLYMRIYFLGMPAMMVYNFGSAVLRAIGDTKRPLYFLLCSGVVNVVLNLISVIIFEMGVAGVAIATIISQLLSAILVVRCLVKTQGYLHLDLKKLRIVWNKLFRMVQIGVPAGLQSVLFALSNVLIQSSVNSFGTAVMAGNTAAGNIEGFVYTSMSSLHQTAISFTGQNFGAQKFDRIKKIAVICLFDVVVVGIVIGWGAYFCGPVLLTLYTSEAEVISYGMTRLFYICVFNFITGMMDVMVGLMRGMRYAVLPMIVSLSGICLIRVIWIFTIFAHNRTLDSLYISYPISWLMTFCVHFVCFVIVYRKLLKRNT